MLCTAILAASSVLAAICSIRFAAPIRKLSSASEKLADLDFNTHLDLHRLDEIGVLAANLNRLASALQTALSELRQSNKHLRSDIERKRRLDHEKREFMAAASHELKTPITIIRGQLEGMLACVGRYRGRDTYLAKCLTETDRLQAMIRDLLLLARLDSGVQPAQETVSLASLVRQCAARLEDLWLRRRLSLQLDLDAICIHGNADLICKAFGNLLLNGALYAASSSVVAVTLQLVPCKV